MTTSIGGEFGGGSVSASDFESVNLADLNSTAPGRRFFYPVSAKLVGKGTATGLPYSGSAPDLGAVESAP